MQKAAQTALDKLRANQAVAPELQDLRRELQALKRAQQALQKKLQDAQKREQAKRNPPLL